MQTTQLKKELAERTAQLVIQEEYKDLTTAEMDTYNKLKARIKELEDLINDLEDPILYDDDSGEPEFGDYQQSDYEPR